MTQNILIELHRRTIPLRTSGRQQAGLRFVDELAAFLLCIPPKTARNTWEHAKQYGLLAKSERGRRSKVDLNQRIVPAADNIKVRRADDADVTALLVRSALSNGALGRP